MERIPREQLHLGTHQTITCPPIVKRVSFPSPPRSDKSVTDPTSTLSLSHSFPRSKLEFHPYSYIEFHVPTSLPQTPHTSMLDYSVNPSNASNQSPASTPPQSPILPIPFNPVATVIIPSYPLLSLQMAINVLITQPNLNDTITYGLVSIVHNYKVAHALQSKGLQETNTAI